MENVRGTNFLRGWNCSMVILRVHLERGLMYSTEKLILVTNIYFTTPRDQISSYQISGFIYLPDFLLLKLQFRWYQLNRVSCSLLRLSRDAE